MSVEQGLGPPERRVGAGGVLAGDRVPGVLELLFDDVADGQVGHDGRDGGFARLDQPDASRLGPLGQGAPRLDGRRRLARPLVPALR